MHLAPGAMFIFENHRIKIDGGNVLDRNRNSAELQVKRMDENATCCEIGAAPHIHRGIAWRSNIILDDCL